MALTYSSMLPLDQTYKFQFTQYSFRQMYSSSEIASEPVLLMIICNHCPYVIHYHNELKKLHHDYSQQLSFLAISSNDVINYLKTHQIK